jgi:hypothetical protein
MDLLAVRHSSHMKDSQSEIAIPKHQQINPIAGRHGTYPNVSQPNIDY